MLDPKDKFLRIAGKIHKIQSIPSIADGMYYSRLTPWSKPLIKEDYPKAFSSILSEMKKYDNYCLKPMNLDYQRDIVGSEGEVYYNKYEPPLHQPKKGSFNLTLYFLKHIFGEQIETGLDYLQLLYLKPTQPQYILCLVSRKRNTGKSTFIHWLIKTYGRNATINSIQDLEGDFNSDWTDKLIVGLDESKTENRSITEKLKTLSTSLSTKIHAKGKDKVETDFFAKFIIASNHTDEFLPIDEEETRFWVREINPFPVESYDPKMLDNLVSEIPAFLFFLKHRTMQTPSPLSRFWIPEKRVWTPALEKAKDGSRSELEKELLFLLKEMFLEIREEILKRGEMDCLRLALNKDIMPLINKTYHKVPSNKVSKILKGWNVENKNSTYTKYSWVEGVNKKVFFGEQDEGRHYIFTPEILGIK